MKRRSKFIKYKLIIYYIVSDYLYYLHKSSSTSIPNSRPQVKLKDFPSDPTYFAKVLDFCFNHKTDPDLIEKLKDEKLKEKLQDLDTKPTYYNGTFFKHIFLILPDSFHLFMILNTCQHIIKKEIDMPFHDVRFVLVSV